GAPGPAETKAVAEFTGDSAVVTVPRRDSTVTLRVKAGPGAVPFIGQGFGLIEEVARRARASGSARYTTTMLSLGDTEPLQVTVERTQSLDFAAVGKGFAPRSLGVLSPPDSVKANVAGAALAVRYSRPSTRGRVIFGNVVPWNQVWRTGANQATIFETSADLVIAGTPVPAGKYPLWTLPSPAGWKLIVNKNTGQWGTDYNAQYDLARLDMKVERLLQPVEQFTIALYGSGKDGVLALSWERTMASIAFRRN